MWFQRMPLEDWFDAYQYEIDYDVGESAVKNLRFDDLNVDIDALPLRYGYHRGRPDLRELVARQYDGLDTNQVLVTNGASEANFAVVSALVEPGDHVIVEHPNYPSLYEVPRSLGCDVSFFRLEPQDRFQPNVDVLKSLISPKTKLISLTHPNNPTGSMISLEALGEVIALAESRGIYLMFDETYGELAFAERLPGAASLSRRVISISSMSKSYGLPGIRIGWLASQSHEIMDVVLAIREQVSICNNAISEAIALSVLQRKDEFIQRALQHAASNLAIVRSWMKDRDDLAWVPPEAGVVTLPWMDKEGVRDPDAVYQRLVEHYRTFVIPGRCFELDNHYFRLGYGGKEEELKVGLQRLASALDEARGERV